MLNRMKPAFGGKKKKKKHKMFTVMIVPHSTSKPIKLDISKAFILSLFLIFAGIVGWAGFIVHKQIDYWVMKSENKILARETEYFAQEMLHARQLADNLRGMERDLRKLLRLKKRKKIIRAGGPATADLERITKYLEDKKLSINPYEFKKHLSALENETEDLKISFGKIKRYIKDKKARWESTPCIRPVRGRITSGFGPRIHPIKKRREIHFAIDIGARRGTPIKATANGEVILAGWHYGYGKLIVIRHGHGYMTRYGHCSKLLVKAGQTVKRGQKIALVGATGCATASHLHYEVWKNGKVRNPKRYLTERILK